MLTPSRPLRSRLAFAPRLALIVLAALGFAACDAFDSGFDERAPRVTILTPGEGAVVGGDEVAIFIEALPAAVGATESDIVSVEAAIDGRSIGGATRIDAENELGLYRAFFDAGQLDDGTYRLEAIAFNSNDARGISEPVTFTVRNGSAGAAPSTQARGVIASPADGANVAGKIFVTIAEDANSPQGITQADILLDGVTIATLSQMPFVYELDTTDLASGAHSLRARLYAANGVTTLTDRVTINIVTLDSNTGDGPGQIDLQAQGFSGSPRGAIALGSNGEIFVSTTSDTLYQFDKRGLLRRKFAARGEILAAPVRGNDGETYLASNDGRLYRLDSSLRATWTYAVSGDLRNSPALRGDGVVVVGDGRGFVHLVDGTSGLSSTVGYPRQVADVPFITPPIITSESIIALGAADGFIYFLGDTDVYTSDAQIGTTGAPFALAERVERSPLPGGGFIEIQTTTLFAAGSGGTLYAIDPVDGSTVWTLPGLTGIGTGAPVVSANGTIYVPSRDGLYEVFLGSDGEPRRGGFYAAPDVGTPAIDREGTLVFVAGRSLVALNPNLTEFFTVPLGTSAPVAPAIDYEGRAIIATDAGTVLGINTGGTAPASSGWASYQGNTRNTGRAGDIDG